MLSCFCSESCIVLSLPANTSVSDLFQLLLSYCFLSPNSYVKVMAQSGLAGDQIHRLLLWAFHCLFLVECYGGREAVEFVLKLICVWFSLQYLELLRSHQNKPMKCLTIMWALGQAGFTDLTEGLKGKSCLSPEDAVWGDPGSELNFHSCTCSALLENRTRTWDSKGMPLWGTVGEGPQIIHARLVNVWWGSSL